VFTQTFVKIFQNFKSFTYPQPVQACQMTIGLSKCMNLRNVILKNVILANQKKNQLFIASYAHMQRLTYCVFLNLSSIKCQFVCSSDVLVLNQSMELYNMST